MIPDFSHIFLAASITRALIGCIFGSTNQSSRTRCVSKMAEGMQKRLQTELDKFKTAQKDYQKYVTTRQHLDAQANENSLVKQELDMLESGASVYKMMGPVLVKQDLTEAKATVEKRIEYITSELKRHDTLIKDLEMKQESQRENINKLQQQFQQAQVKAAAKA